jgi:hypothetical protein
MKTFTIALIIFSFISFGLTGQETRPINSNYLFENGISPRVLDAAASLFTQEGCFTTEVTMIKKINGVEKKYDLELIFNPNYKYGMDLRVVNKSENLSKKEKRKLRKYIEKSHYFSRLSKDYIYNESSLKLARIIGDTTILEFYYQKKNIDPYLKSIKKLKGFVYIINGKLDKVVLINIKPLKNNISKFKKTVKYAKTNEGGYIVTSFKEEITAEKGENTIKTIVNSKTTKYKDPKGNELTWKNKPSISPAPVTTIHDTLNVKLGGPLPIWGKPVKKLGFQLPQPVGVAGFVYAHNQLLEFTGLEVSFDGGKWHNLENVFALNESKVNQLSTIYLAKADVWLFPFLNVMFMIGGGQNDLNGELVLNKDLVDFLNGLPGWIIDIPNLPASIPINSSVTSEVYGGGAILAGGVDKFNITVNYQLLFTKIVEANTTNMVNIITPMLGYELPFGINLLAGAQGQFYNTRLKGFFDIEDPNGGMHRLDYYVDFEPVKWNGIAGLYIGFYKHWEMSVQMGFGQRTSVTAVFGYRF